MAKNVVFLGRQPPAKDFIGKFLSNVGGVLRSVGVAVDNLGSSVQGKAGSVQESLKPNTAWMPYKLSESETACSAPGYTPVVGTLFGTEVALPSKGANVFIAPNAHVIGNVKLGSNSSIWYGAVLRGDVNAIIVGDNTNIQDNVVVHVAKNAVKGPRPTIIGDNVTIGHGAIVHACVIGDNSLVGINATVMDGAKVEAGALIAAGATVAPGTVVPSGQIWAGSPARFLRALTEAEAGFVKASADNYALLAADHSDENCKQFEELVVDRKIYEEKVLRGNSEIDVHMGIHRDPQTQGILSANR
jgi:gamma-carbonic anhydrase